jgi:hypothetical protein
MKIVLKKLLRINYYLILAVTLSVIFFSCREKKNKEENTQINDSVQVNSFNPGVIFQRLTKANSSYSCYIPSDYQDDKKYPVIIFLDPHADGNLPLEKYKSLAEKIKFILIGSNSTKNGMEIDQCKQVVFDLMSESITVLPGLDHQVTIAGFSGGAKVALVSSTALNGLNSVVYCGAALPSASIRINTASMGIAGQYDMNYTEVRNFNYSLSVAGNYHTIVEWKGKHEWPDSSAFIHAFYWNIFTSMKNNIIPKNDTIILEFKRFISQKINQEKNILVKSELLQEEIDMLDRLTIDKEAFIKLSNLNKSSEFKNAFSKFSKVLKREDELKKMYAQSFEEEDLNWWNKQISILRSDSKNESNQRILGYISLASWTYSTKALSANNNTLAFKSLQIYKLSDPENSEQPFLMACLYAKNNLHDSAIFYLNEAYKLGLNDRNKVDSEKDLYALHQSEDYKTIVEKMR